MTVLRTSYIFLAMRLVWDIPIYINKETESKLYNMLKSHNELVVELTQAD